MRFVALLLLFTAVGSLQLPWVTCEVDTFHLDLGSESDCDHDHGDSRESDDHESVNWSAVAGGHASAILVAPALYGCVRVQGLPVAGESHAAIHARAIAPPIAAGPLTAVLLL